MSAIAPLNVTIRAHHSYVNPHTSITKRLMQAWNAGTEVITTIGTIAKAALFFPLTWPETLFVAVPCGVLIGGVNAARKITDQENNDWTFHITRERLLFQNDMISAAAKVNTAIALLGAFGGTTPNLSALDAEIAEYEKGMNALEHNHSNFAALMEGKRVAIMTSYRQKFIHVLHFLQEQINLSNQLPQVAPLEREVADKDEKLTVLLRQIELADLAFQNVHQERQALDQQNDLNAAHNNRQAQYSQSLTSEINAELATCRHKEFDLSLKRISLQNQLAANQTKREELTREQAHSRILEGILLNEQALTKTKTDQLFRDLFARYQPQIAALQERIRVLEANLHS